MITYNKAKPASNEMSDYKRVPRTDDFSWDLSFLQSSQLLREPCQLYHHQCKWHFKESLQWAGNTNADQRCWCSAHFSQKLCPLLCVCSLASDRVIFWCAPSAFASQTPAIKKSSFSTIRAVWNAAVAAARWTPVQSVDIVKSAGFCAW